MSRQGRSEFLPNLHDRLACANDVCRLMDASNLLGINFAWHREIRWWKKLHRWRWNDVRRHHTGRNGRWPRPSADGVELFNLAKVPITRYGYRGAQIPNP